MTKAAHRWFGVGALWVGPILGCAQRGATESAAPAPAVAEAVPVAAPGGDLRAVDPKTGEMEPGASAPAAHDEPAAAQAAEFEPPFPDRVDLFVAPKRLGAVAAQDGAGNAVELLGFVRVDAPRAVLSINGEIAPLAEGDEQFGVAVISVRPPNVVLQRGRQRWQATLE